MPRRWRSSTEAVSKPSGRGTLAEVSVSRLTSRLRSAVSPPIDGLILAARRWPIGNCSGAPLRSRPQLAPSEAAEDAGDPVSQNGAEADAKHDDPPNPGRKTVHGVVSPPARTEAMLRSRWLMRCEHAVANVAPGISRSARVHSHGAATLAGSGRAVSLPG